MTFDSVHDPAHLYFVTATICGWKHLFVNRTYLRIILDSLAWLRTKQRMQLFAFVIMPSHLHFIARPLDREIGNLLNNFGSFTAHAILRQLRKNKESALIEFFHAQRRDRRHEHSIWQDIQVKNIFSREFLIQKVEYIHQNPVDKEWNLVEDRANYPYSSACFYDKTMQPIIEIDDVRDYI